MLAGFDGTGQGVTCAGGSAGSGGPAPLVFAFAPVTGGELPGYALTGGVKVADLAVGVIDVGGQLRLHEAGDGIADPAPVVAADIAGELARPEQLGIRGEGVAQTIPVLGGDLFAEWAGKCGYDLIDEIGRIGPYGGRLAGRSLNGPSQIPRFEGSLSPRRWRGGRGIYYIYYIYNI